MIMTDPVTKVRDKDGNVHFFSTWSKDLQDGLKDGTYLPFEEVPSATALQSAAGDLDTGAGDSGPGDGEPEAGDTDSAAGDGPPQPKSRR